MQLTVLFEDPFWVGVFERRDETGYSVCRVVFGSEPTDAQVYEFVRENYRNLRFSDPVVRSKGPETGGTEKVNPKRAQREARRAIENVGVSTKAQEAMRLDLESRKQVRKIITQAEREEEARRLYVQKQQKKKQKLRGH